LVTLHRGVLLVSQGPEWAELSIEVINFYCCSYHWTNLIFLER
jgi:hypothetical protein